MKQHNKMRKTQLEIMRDRVKDTMKMIMLID
jgi:uncharacterized protein YnzC (UPF0291/DUF896 family)